MSDFFDDLVGPAEDFSSANSSPAGGALVVPQRAPSGSFLNVEAEAFRAALALHSLVLFIESDQNTGEPIFSNAGEFADKMSSMSLPNEEQAYNWLQQRLCEHFEAWEERLAEAWEEAEAKAPAVSRPKPEDASVIWRRPPHSTGRQRGQDR